MSDLRVCSAGLVHDPKGHTAQYDCYYCRARNLHRGDMGCSCSEKHPDHYGTVCRPCGEALRALNADTVLGRVHKAIVRQAELKHMRGSDD